MDKKNCPGLPWTVLPCPLESEPIVNEDRLDLELGLGDGINRDVFVGLKPMVFAAHVLAGGWEGND